VLPVADWEFAEVELLAADLIFAG